MPFSYAQYAGNGSTTTFSVPFPYLLKAHVKLYTGFNILTGAYTSLLVDGVDYTWTSTTQVQTTVAPANGVTLTVLRDTPDSTQLVPWQDGSNLVADDMNIADLQNLYVVQEQQDRNDAGITQSTAAAAAATAATTAANTATSTANTALSTANTALSNANAAVSTANTASSNASAAVSTANTASSNASAAVTTANAANATAGTASTNASNAVTTANAAAANAATALSTANTAATNASAAVSTANTASSNAAAAVSTANTANTNASNAVTTANTASTNASAAVSTANAASTAATSATTTANTANNKADQAIAAVSNSVNYQLKANVAAIPASPANDTYIEVQDSTGLESFTPLAGKPAGFVGDAGLSVRLRYTTAGTTWNWLNYYANDSDARFLKKTGGTMTGPIVLSGAPTTGLNPATKTYVDGYVSSLQGDIATVSAAAAAAQSTANAALPKAGGTMTGKITLDGNPSANLHPATKQYVDAADATLTSAAAAAQSTANTAVSNAAAAQSTANTAVTNAATAQSTANTAVTNAAAAQATADAALPKAGGTATGNISAPAFIPTGGTAPTNGVYLPAANSVAISTNGSGRLFVDSSGRVGVGDSSPSARLVCNGSIQVTSSTNPTTGAGLEIGYGTVNASRTALQSYNRTGSAWLGADYNALDYRFYISGGGSPQMTLTSTGLGIGTTSPTAALNVSTGGTDLVADFVGTSSPYIRIDNGTKKYIAQVTGSDFRIQDQTANAERLRIDSSGRLLVGTSSSNGTTYSQPALQIAGTGTAAYPELAIHNYGTANTLARLTLGKSPSGTVGSQAALTADYSFGAIAFEGSNGSAWAEGARIMAVNDKSAAWTASSNPTRLVFSTTADGASSPTERMRITESGFSRFTKSGSYNDSGVGNNHYFQNDLANNGVLILTAYNNSFDNVVQQNTCLRAANTAYSFFRGVSGNGSTSFADNEFNLRGNGNGECDGSWTGGGADYAEYFEWSDSNPNAQDRRGISVVLDGNKIREAVTGEDPIGVISGNPSVVGDAAWNKWNGKYLRDEFGTYLLDKNGNRQLSPDFDPDQEYVPREQRPEWDCVGLMGKLRIRKGQITGSRWIKMRDISDSVEEWLVR